MSAIICGRFCMGKDESGIAFKVAHSWVDLGESYSQLHSSRVEEYRFLMNPMSDAIRV
jgi:hypothetical protein